MLARKSTLSIINGHATKVKYEFNIKCKVIIGTLFIVIIIKAMAALTNIPTTNKLTWINYFDHFLARCGVNRMEHKVNSGLYSLGNPNQDSPIFVTANYTLSFDSLRSSLLGMNVYILVMDTNGINVWCAAGKGTFGSARLIELINSLNLDLVVRHRNIILPQLSASGVSGYEVKRQTGFQVEFGPVRAADLPEYLESHQATPEMRQVKFALSDRMILIPVEIMNLLLPFILASLALFLLGGLFSALAASATVLAGTVLFFIFFPWIPTRDFSTKGLILGLAVAVPFTISQFNHVDRPWLTNLIGASSFLLLIPAATGYITLNMTGSTPITSRTAVKKEIYKYIPILAWMAAVGILFILLQFLVAGK